MPYQVAFLRAINVAGHARVRMDELRCAFAAAGCQEVRTTIQSGNVLFRSARGEQSALRARVRSALRRLLDEEPVVVFRTASNLGGPDGARRRMHASPPTSRN